VSGLFPGNAICLDLLTLLDVQQFASSVKTTLSGGARRLTRFLPKIACCTIPCEASTEAATRSIESRALSGLLTLTLNISLLADPEELGNAGKVPMGRGPPRWGASYAGRDFIIARDGRIAAVYLFFDKLP
jgi:hypothetical protein